MKINSNVRNVLRLGEAGGIHIFKKNKRLVWLGFTALCCVAAAGVWGLRTSAASGTASVGNLSTDGGEVIIRSQDIDYLNNELNALQSEIDYSVFGDASAGVQVSASVDRLQGQITSHGTINYDNGKVIANAANLIALADETDALADTYATVICRALNEIGTYFDSGGNVNHVSQVAESAALGYEQFREGILQSQSVDHLEASPVTADNITAGAAAWVNGQYIIGNGADNDRAYQRGTEDGKAENIQDVEIEYVYHVHKNGKGQEVGGNSVYASSNPGGCYVADGHTHNQGGSNCSYKTGTHEVVVGTETCGCIGFENESLSGYGYDFSTLCDNCYHVYGYHNVGDGKCRTTLREITETREYYYWSCNGDGEGTEGQRVNTWKIGCGKTTKYIEEAKIIIR